MINKLYKHDMIYKSFGIIINKGINVVWNLLRDE